LNDVVTVILVNDVLTVVSYVLTAVAGASVFIVLGALSHLSASIPLFVVLGSFVATVSAYITDIFHEPT
jgi:hypothetical protein